MKCLMWIYFLQNEEFCEFIHKSDSKFWIFFSIFQGIKMDNKGHIVVDEFQNTTGSKIYALGDVCGKALLTPGK